MDEFPFDELLPSAPPYPKLLASIIDGDMPAVRHELEQLAQKSQSTNLTPVLLHCIYHRQGNAMATLLENEWRRMIGW